MFPESQNSPPDEEDELALIPGLKLANRASHVAAVMNSSKMTGSFLAVPAG